MPAPFEMGVRITSSNKGYIVEVTLDAKDSTNPIHITKKKTYADLNDFSDLRQEAINEYNRKVSELQ